MHTHLPDDGPAAGPLPTDTFHLTAVDPVDLVSYVQHVLGFPPRDSLTAITLADRSLGAVLRCDWDATLADDPRGLDRYVAQVAGYLGADERADGCLVILFRDSAEPDCPYPDEELALLDALDRELDRAGLPMQEAWLVSSGRIWHLDCQDPGGCSFHGSDLARTRDSALNVAFIVQGSVVAHEPPTGLLPPSADEASEELTAALEEAAAGRGQVEPCARWLQAWEKVLCGGGLPADASDRARLIAGLGSEHLRDTLVAAASFTLVRAVSGAEWLDVLPSGSAAAVNIEPREVNGVLYSCVLMATSRRAPDWERIDRLRAACEGLLPEAAGTPASALRCLAAWVEWARGRGSTAGPMVEACRRADPDYSLGQVLGEIVDRGILSGWAGRRSTAWSSRSRA